jgi:thiamine-phosphate pyrophosphorylase
MDKRISQLHYITQEISGAEHHIKARQACEAGVDWVQLRVKDRSYNDWLDIALKTELVCRKYHARLIINDNPAIAKAAGADGVHLGKTDCSPKEARQLLGEHAIIGGTANTPDDILRLVEEKVDYIGLGPFRFTETKKNLSPVLGLEGYKNIVEFCAKEKILVPIIAIGGIRVEDVKSLIATGVHGIAVSSAINTAASMSETVKKFMNKIRFENDKLSKR